MIVVRQTYINNTKRCQLYLHFTPSSSSNNLAVRLKQSQMPGLLLMKQERGGMGVQAWVADFVNSSNPILRLFSRTCIHTTSNDNHTRPHKKHKQHDKHHHRGSGAAHPSSGMEFTSPRRWRGGRPYTYFFRRRLRRDLIES